MSSPVVGMLFSLLLATAAHADCNMGSERHSDGSVRKMDDDLLYRCGQGQWIPWDPKRGAIHVVAASWFRTTVLGRQST